MDISGLPILVVEDSAEDFEATIRTFRKSGIDNPVVHCVDGDQALDYLNCRGEYATPSSALRPILIMLDLNMPGTDGREVLAQVKSDHSLKSIPVIILTTSDHEEDVESCYRVGANGYVRKPVDLSGFTEVIRNIKEFWLDTAILPTGTGQSA